MALLNKSLLVKCSYFEAFLPSLNAYVGKFPSPKTSPLGVDAKAFVGKRLFPDIDMTNSVSRANAIASLSAYIDYLNQNKFGFNDNIGFFCENLSKGKTATASAICAHLGSLFVADAEQATANHHKIVVKSDDDDTFSVALFARAGTAPQEAIDTFVLFKHSTNKAVPVMTTLGYKKTSEEFTISFENSVEEQEFKEVDPTATQSSQADQSPRSSVKTTVKVVLKVGLNGYIAGPGEHLEESEKKEIGIVLAENAEALAQNRPVKINRARKIIARSCDEEAGLKLDEHQNCSHWLIGVHNAPGRDPRYWASTLKTEDGSITFGYERPSTSILFAVVVPCAEIPTDLPEPSDGAECAKNQVIPFDDLVANFRVGGKYNPAFASHVENVAMLVKSGLHKM